MSNIKKILKTIIILVILIGIGVLVYLFVPKLLNESKYSRKIGDANVALLAWSKDNKDCFDEKNGNDNCLVWDRTYVSDFDSNQRIYEFKLEELAKKDIIKYDNDNKEIINPVNGSSMGDEIVRIAYNTQTGSLIIVSKSLAELNITTTTKRTTTTTKIINNNDDNDDNDDSEEEVHKTNRPNSSTNIPQTTTSSKPSKIHFIDTNGGSDAILIESDGHYGLVDSSNPYGNSSTEKYARPASESIRIVLEYLKKLNVEHLDFVIATHAHSDHIGGMVELASSKYVKTYNNQKTVYYYKPYIGTKEDTTTDYDNKGYYTKAFNAMKKAGVSLYDVTNKDVSFDFGDFKIKLYNTEKKTGLDRENRNSIVEYITYKGRHKTLLVADFERPEEMALASKIGHVVLLKVGHHGLKSATGFDFVTKLYPDNVVITNSSIPATFLPVGYYMQQKFGTKTYLSGAANGAIVVDYNDNNCVVNANGSTQTFKVSQTQRDWRYISNGSSKTWMVYKSGKPVYSDWYKDSTGDWYYLNEAGTYVTGWQKLNWDGSTNWYYFFDSGRMAKGWQKINNYYYYFLSSGKMVTGWQQVDGAWYYMNDSGRMVTGWQKLNWNGNSNWYYFLSNGKMATGLNIIDGTWYYFYSGGSRAENTCLNINNIKRCFDYEGICYKGC